MLFWLWTVAMAAPDDAADEEVVVYGDEFARWDETRWLVQAEMWLPLGIWFGMDNNLAFESNVFQVRAVVFCEKDARLTKRRYEIGCRIEDVGILATTTRNWKRPDDRALVQTVLDDVDAKLTGRVVQLQVDDQGGVTNFDLEGIEADNQRQREIQESLRQVVSRLMSGFHLRIPDHAQRAGQWVEYNSELMDMPSLTSSRGSTTLLHQVSPYQGMQLVQTVGEGSVFVSVPNRRLGPSTDGPTLSDTGSSVARPTTSATSSAPTLTDAPVNVNSGAAGETGIEVSYKLVANGVAVFRKADGIMTERVWNVEGEPTASSGGGVNTGPFRNAGRVQLLEQGQTGSVGRTAQVGWPGREMEGLPNWQPLDTGSPGK